MNEVRTISSEEINRCISSFEPKPQPLSDLLEFKERLEKYKNSDAWLVIGFVQKANCLSTVIRPSWTDKYSIDQMFVSKEVVMEYLLERNGLKPEDIAQKLDACFQKDPQLLKIRICTSKF